MAFAVKTNLAPMEAKSVEDIPTGDGWQYEPKWDGFRCLVFRDGDKVELRSKSSQPLARYFPEIAVAVPTAVASDQPKSSWIAGRSVPNRMKSYTAMVQAMKAMPDARRVSFPVTRRNPGTFGV